MYPGYRNVVVLAAITADTSAFVCANVGFWMCSRSTAMRFSAVLSNTTTQSALRVNRFSVSNELYGCTTTSLVSFWFGNTEYVCTSFLPYRSLSASSRYEPMPDPVPPAMEWHSTNPSNESDPSASRSIMSMISSVTASACAYPLAQLFPAPPPCEDTKKFSALYRFRYSEFWMVLMTLGSRSRSRARGT